MDEGVYTMEKADSWQINDSDLLIYFEDELVQYTISLYYDGLYYEDYEYIENNIIPKLDRLMDCYSSDSAIYKKLYELYISYNEISKMLRDKVANPLSVGDYLQKECSLVHLVFSNNTHPKIRPYADDSFMFLCQFHLEKTPSLGITSSKGLGHCYGCGTGFNVIKYIMEYENLTFKEAICLLAKVYMIKIPRNYLSNADPLVIKYREVLLSDEFKNLLLMGQERVNKSELVTASIKRAKEKYDQTFETIDRIKRGEWKSYIGYKNTAKKLVLPLPEFEN